MQLANNLNFNFHQKALVFNKENKFLALKATYKGLNWDIPGGKVELPELTEEALRREIKEESALVVDDIRPLLVSSAYNHEENFYVMVIIYKCLASSEHVVISSEHSEYKWVTKEEFLQLDAIHYLKEYIKQVEL